MRPDTCLMPDASSFRCLRQKQPQPNQNFLHPTSSNKLFGRLKVVLLMNTATSCGLIATPLVCITRRIVKDLCCTSTGKEYRSNTETTRAPRDVRSSPGQASLTTQHPAAPSAAHQQPPSPPPPHPPARVRVPHDHTTKNYCAARCARLCSCHPGIACGTGRSRS